MNTVSGVATATGVSALLNAPKQSEPTVEAAFADRRSAPIDNAQDRAVQSALEKPVAKSARSDSAARSEDARRALEGRFAEQSSDAKRSREAAENDRAESDDRQRLNDVEAVKERDADDAARRQDAIAERQRSAERFLAAVEAVRGQEEKFEQVRDVARAVEAKLLQSKRAEKAAQQFDESQETDAEKRQPFLNDGKPAPVTLNPPPEDPPFIPEFARGDGVPSEVLPQIPEPATDEPDQVVAA